MSQNEQIRRFLESGKAITQLEALNKFGCFRLASRIWDLERQGMTISRQMIPTPSGKNVAQYSIKK